MNTIDGTKVWSGITRFIPRSLHEATWPLAILIVLIGAWEVVIPVLDVPGYILPPPSAVASAFLDHHPTIIDALLVTLQAFAIAFGLTVLTGYVLALAMYEWTPLETTVYPYVIAARAIPIVALIPIFVIWFGFGFRSIVIISYLISVFAMVVNSLAGFKSTDPKIIEMLDSFSATRWDRFRHVHLYGSMPLVLAGTKICVILAFTGVIVGEFLIGTEGIGYLIMSYNSTFDTAPMFAGIVTIAVTQLSLFGAVVLLERSLITWR